MIKRTKVRDRFEKEILEEMEIKKEKIIFSNVREWIKDNNEFHILSDNANIINIFTQGVQLHSVQIQVTINEGSATIEYNDFDNKLQFRRTVIKVVTISNIKPNHNKLS